MPGPRGPSVSSLEALLHAPHAPRRPHVHEEHGVRRDDPYAWMRHRDDEAFLPYLREENAYTEKVMAAYEGQRKALFEEMKGRIKPDDASVPVLRRGMLYYSREEQGKNYPIHCRKGTGEADPEQVMLDVNQLAEGEAYLALGALTVSLDGRWMAYAVDTSGDEIYDLYIKDLTTGDVVGPVVEGFTGNVVWAADPETLWYTTHDETLRPDTVWRMRWRSPEGAAPVFHEADARFRVGVGRTRSDGYLVVGVHSSLTSEVHVAPGDAPWQPLRCVAPRKDGVEYHLTHWGDRFLVHTNYCPGEDGEQTQGALNFRVMEAPVDGTSMADWVSWLAHRSDVHVLDVDAFARGVVVAERAEGVRRLRVISAEGEQRVLDMPETVYTAWLGQNPEYDTAWLRVIYTSMVTPSTTLDVQMWGDERVVRKVQPVLGGFEAERYATERLWFEARDGTRVPLSVVYRWDLRQDGPQPTFIYAYGSYGIPTEPAFSTTRLSLLDRGVVFVMAHVRGSGDLGRRWYEDGKFLHKRNTFFDVEDAARFLQATGWTTPEQTALMGGSAGGLMVGAVLNAAPECFRVAVASVPFVDVVSTMLDETIPLTTNEWEEWGNPADPTYFHYMLSYSPYDNVASQAYPALLVTAGLNDPRVQIWEPAKWVARLRQRNTGRHPLLFKVEMEAGHGGQSGRYGWLEDVSYEYAFVLHELGVLRDNVTSP